MRYLFGFLCVCALSLVPLVGCDILEGDCPGGCSDGNPCTHDDCGLLGCFHPSVADGTPCHFNSLSGVCIDGVCDLCAGVVCDDGNECSEEVCADGVCDNPPVEDGTLCVEGLCIDGDCGPIGSVFPCTEQGIRAAIATGGGPYTFSCDGPTIVTTKAEIVIDNDVILDGENNLTVDGNDDHRVFSVPEGVTAELRGFTITAGKLVGRDNSILCLGHFGAGVHNSGTLTVEGCTISSNYAHISACPNDGIAGGGMYNAATGIATISNSTLSGNTADGSGGGIDNDGVLTITGSTVSANSSEPVGGGAIGNQGIATVTNSTVSGNLGGGIQTAGTLTIANSLVDGDCSGDPVTSLGYNIESPGNTCGFDRGTDQPGKTPEELKLGDLADNGGPTETHALGAGSVAIDWIPEADCGVSTDQRAQPRPEAGGSMCDVGAFEVQP